MVAVRSVGDLLLARPGGSKVGEGGEALELGTQPVRPRAEEQPAEQVRRDEGEQHFQVGEQQGGGLAGLLAWHTPGCWWGLVHRGDS